MTSYASMTHGDRNPLKRWLQNRRLDDALSLVPAGASRVVDFGGGDGELCLRLKTRRPGVEAICFEPTPSFCWEAEQKLRGIEGLSLTDKESDISSGWADAVVCAEVFEHLPGAEMDIALAEIDRILAPGGVVVLGVPVEIGAPALAKGLFRFLRRPGAPDARWPQIISAALRRPHGPRFTLQIAEGRAYHPLHLGFDHRQMLAAVSARFHVVAQRGTPWGAGGAALNSEVYFVARKR